MKYLSRFSLVALVSVVSTAGLLPQCASAQAWPAQSVRIVVPYPPGTATDVLGRTLAERLQAKWKQPVVIDNKAGASEMLAATNVATAQPDGYTLLLASEVGLETNQFLFSKLQYNPVTDFTPIVKLIEGPLVLVVRGDSRFKSMQDIAAAARKDPGAVSYGSAGVGGSVHLTADWMSKVGGFEVKHVPYRGSSFAVQDVLAGVIDFTLTGPPTAAPLVQSGQLRALAVTSPSRMKMLPDAPTTVEAGYRDSTYMFMFGLVGPARLPPSIAQKIAADVTEILSDPAFQAKNTEPFGYVVGGGTPEDFIRFLGGDREKHKVRVKSANVKLD